MTDRDTIIKRCINEFGPLTVDLLALLKDKEPILGAPDTLWRRLQAHKPLVKEKHLYVWRGFPGQKYIYASWDISKRKDLAHDLITSTVHITLYLFFDLRHFRRTKEKFKGKLNEDAYFALGIQLPDRVGEFHYYLESDTGSEGYAQIEEKLERYLKHYRDTSEKFFVLFVTTEAARAADLAKRAVRVIPRDKRKLYLFTSATALTATPRAAICHVPHEPKTFYPLLPSLK